MNNFIRIISNYFSNFCSIEYIFCSKKYKHHYAELFDPESDSEPEPSRVNNVDYQEIMSR